jgi:NAD(P)-dependent dehydrogenase (short-subunit alcohol dehydrogenase family)
LHPEVNMLTADTIGAVEGAPAVAQGVAAGENSVSGAEQRPHDAGLQPAPSLPVLPRLDGRAAFVAGASRGIGRDIAIGLADAGASVAVAGRTVTEGRLPGTIYSVTSTIQDRGGQAIAVYCDLTAEETVEQAVATTAEAFGHIDILVANAATIWLPPTLETPLKRWELTIRVNLTGTFLVTKAVLPHILATGTGSLIAITTTGAYQTELGSNAYWTSKAGIERYYLGLASELRPHNIAVNCLAPRKVILTEGAIAGGMADRVSDDMVEDPSAIVQAAVWLASQDASGVTGTVQYSLDLVEKLSDTAFPL